MDGSLEDGKKTCNEEYCRRISSLHGTFENLTDPRGGRAKRHYFGEVLLIALAVMVSGMDDFEDFERFAEERVDCLQLPNGNQAIGQSESITAMQFLQSVSFNNDPVSKTKLRSLLISFPAPKRVDQHP